MLTQILCKYVHFLGGSGHVKVASTVSKLEFFCISHTFCIIHYPSSETLKLFLAVQLSPFFRVGDIVKKARFLSEME